MSECEMCHGKGTIPCPTCKGEKTEPCKKCNGSGKVPCKDCSGNGKIRCDKCYGTGKEVCPVCYKGKVEKTRWINCSNCGGDGRSHSDGSKCSCCYGRGQVEERYYEICPNCHGDYAHYSDNMCQGCKGHGYVTCSKCHGEKLESCGKCKGTGHLICSHCKGSGSEKCPACEQREKARKEQEAREERARREKRRKEAYEKEQARQRAKRRVRIILGILWRIPLSIAVGFLFWWWFEGFNKEALPGMLEQVKGIRGGISKNLSLAMMVSGGTLVALYLLTLILSKLSFSFEGVVLVLSSLIGCVPAVVLITSGHWGVGGWMALAIVCAIGAKFDGKAHESWWRWVLMSIGLWVSGGFGMNGNWIISSVITAFSMGILLKDEK